MARLQQAIVEAQAKLKELRIKEDEHDTTILQLKGELQKKNMSLVPSRGYIIDFAILLDSEENLQWFKKRAHEMMESLTTMQLEDPHNVLRVGVVFYNSQKGGSERENIRILQFTEDFQKITLDLPQLPREGHVFRAGLKGALGEALNLLQWQGLVRLLVHPSPSSIVQKGQDPPAPQNSHFFRFSSDKSNANVETNNNPELQRAVLAMRAMCIDYFIMKTGFKKSPSSQKKGHQGDGKFMIAMSRYFDDPESCLECKFIKIEEPQNIKKAIISCISIALRS